MLADESGAFALAGGTDAGDLTGGVDGGDALSGVAAAAVGGSEDSVRSCGCVHCCLTVGLMEGRDGLLERALRCVAVMLCCYSLVRSAQQDVFSSFLWFVRGWGVLHVTFQMTFHLTLEIFLNANKRSY